MIGESCSVVPDSLRPHGIFSPWNSPGQNTGVGSLSLLQGIFPPRGLNPGLPHCRQIIYQLSHKGSPRILEWVAYPFSSRFQESAEGIEPGSPALQVDSLPTELLGLQGMVSPVAHTWLCLGLLPGLVNNNNCPHVSGTLLSILHMLTH